MKRRTFLLAGTGALGALVVGWSVLPPRQRLTASLPLAVENGEIALNGWIKLTPEGKAVVAMPRTEMGQGILTGVAMIAAEELDLPLDRVRVVQAPRDRIFGNVKLVEDGLPLRGDDHGATARSLRWIAAKVARELGVNVTGGSSSIKDLWLPVREAAAQARATLVEACAKLKEVPAAACRTEAGFVVLPGGDRMAYGEIVRAAPAMTPASRYNLKPQDQFRLLGSGARRVDAPQSADGSAIFGLDVRLPDMRYAALVMAPSVGARLVKRNVPEGVTAIRIPPGYGQDEALAIVADGWWEAYRLAESIQPEWDESAGAQVDNAAIDAALHAALEREAGRVYHAAGDVDEAFRQTRRIHRDYATAYLAHATLEPMNCTAWVQDGKVRVWAPTQVPTVAVATAARVAGVSCDAVELTVTRLGGGFGRRLEVDYVAQAVAIAMQTGGRPVQMIWTRPQDMGHDMYRPAAVCRVAAGIDEAGRVLALETRVASDRVTAQWAGRIIWSPLASPALDNVLPDKTTVEGFFDTPYDVPHQRHAHVTVPSPLPVGFLRSVGHSLTGFFMESFLDELAVELGKDPLALRRELLATRPRHLAVLDLVAEKSGYGSARQQELKAKGRALGLAMHESFGSIVAQVVEVSMEGGRPRAHRVVSAVDVGLAINPDLVAQQMEGSVVMGLGAAIDGRIDVEKGRVRQRYFTDYPILTMVEAPVVETYIVQSREPPKGLGEVGMPPIAPALANALFALRGERRRVLPLSDLPPPDFPKECEVPGGRGEQTLAPEAKARPVALNLNGKPVVVEMDPGMPLLWVLRDRINLTGTKFGCGIGACGACTVLVGGEARPSCTLTLGEAEGKDITTIEAVADDSLGKALQEAWVACNVPQCGYCQSGQLITALALLKRKAKPTDADIDCAMGPKLCRCGTYQRIRAAICKVARGPHGAEGSCGGTHAACPALAAEAPQRRGGAAAGQAGRGGAPR